MADDDDRLAQAKARIACEHLSDARLGARLHGGNNAQLRDDTERMRREAHVIETGERYGLGAAIHVYRERQRRLAARVFGPRSPGSRGDVHGRSVRSTRTCARRLVTAACAVVSCRDVSALTTRAARARPRAVDRRPAPIS